VEEIALYNTTFRKMDGGIVMFNNALISATGFSNLSRSGLHNESLKAREPGAGAQSH
jgi:small-conductance mechanosensitive channel